MKKKLIDREMRCNHCGAQCRVGKVVKKCGSCGSELLTVVQDYVPTAIDGPARRLEDLVEHLNSIRDATPTRLGTVAAARLKEYVDSWLECRPDALEWRYRFPEHWKSLCKALENTHLILVPFPDGFVFNWDKRDHPESAEQAALWKADKLFADFLSESQGYIGICKGCRRYFVKTSKRTEYHSTACSHNATSRPPKALAFHNKRHQKFRRMIAIVQKLTADYSKAQLSAAGFWQEEVIRLAPKMNFRTRWLNETVDDRKKLQVWASCATCTGYRKQIQALVQVKGKYGKG